MRAVKFKEANIEIAKNQEEYHTLHAFRAPPEADRYGQTITCWTMSWKEWFRFIFTGKIYLNVLTFNEPLQPLNMGTRVKDVVLEEAE